MKKVLRLAGLMAVAIFAWRGAEARITGTPPSSADIFCVGPTALETCVDASANIIPTTTGVGSLGTSTLKWNTINASGAATISGASVLGAAGAVSSLGTGNTTAVTPTTVAGTLVPGVVAVGTGQSGVLGIYVSTTIPVSSSYETLLSSAGPIRMTSTPTISTLTVTGGVTAIADGTFLVITSSSTDTITLVDNDTLTGSLLELGAATRAISAKKVLLLMFQAGIGKWIEIAYGGN